MDKKVTLSILTYYDNKIKEWAVSLVDKSLESLGNVFTVKGIVSSTSDLPQELNTVGDVYLVGPTEDGGYAEYIWIETSKWEFIGTTTSTEVTGGVSEQELYAGSDNTGTPATPAEGTVLYAFDEALKAYIEAVSGSEFSQEEKEKLAGIEAGAEVNVQSDWNELDDTSDAFIKNKPVINATTIPMSNEDTTTVSKAIEDKQDRVNGVIATTESLTMDRIIDSANQMRLKIGEDIVATFPAPTTMFTPQTTFVAKEIKSFYEELGLTPETVNGYEYGSSSDPSQGNLNYFTEENGPYLVLTKMDVMEPLNLYGGNVILLKDILPKGEIANLETLTIQLNGETVDTYNGDTAKVININAATQEYVDNLDKNNVKYSSDNNVEFKNHAVIPFGSGLYGNSPDNGWTNLAAVRGYNLDTEEEVVQSEFGSASLHTNINSKDRPTVETSEGQEDVAYLSDIEKEGLYVQIPIRTLQDKVYTKEEILGWFGVEDEAELKTKIVRNYFPILKYGITLSYNPHYYKMPIEYLAFESANQIKLVFTGLDTSNDVVSKYEILINLDGTIIENNSNIKVTITSLENSSSTSIINDEQSSLETTYSSEKISSLLQTLKTEIEQANELEII